jgi:hypothetical protein
MIKAKFTLVAFLITGIFSWAFPGAVNPAGETVIIEGSLFLQETQTLSVLVTGVDASTAASVVEELGGQVVSDMSSANTVAATIPADQIDALAIHPAIRAIRSN